MDADQTVDAALVLTPEEPLADALTVVLALQQALTDALGALGPPETAVMWSWPDALLINGGDAGRMRVAAATDAPGDVPEWLVVGLRLTLRSPDGEAAAPQQRRAVTSLADEDLGDLAPDLLIAAWARHSVRWIYAREADGLRPLAEAWTARAAFRDKQVDVAGAQEPCTGAFLGLDDRGGLLVQSQNETVGFPLAVLLTRRWDSARMLGEAGAP